MEILPGVGGVVRQLVGSDADDGAVFLMQRQDLAVDLAREGGASEGDARGCPELWSGVYAKGVEENVVDESPEEVGGALDEWSDAVSVEGYSEIQLVTRIEGLQTITYQSNNKSKG